MFLFSALTCTVALAYKLRDLRTNRHDQALLALIAAFGCKTVSLTLSSPATSAVIERWIGVPNLCALVVHLFGGVASSTALLIALGYWSYPPERARSQAKIWLVVSSVMAGTLTTLWVVAGSVVSTRPGNYLLDNMQHPIVAVYLLLYIIAFAAGLLETLRLCVRYAEMAANTWLRRGLRITAIGSAVYLAYCLHRLAALTAVWLHAELPTPELLTPLCVGVGVNLVAFGLTLPSWGTHLSTASSRLAAYRQHQALYPLWLKLYRATPSIALEPPRSRLRDRLRVRDVRFHLYRRVIEINDGRLALRPFMDDAVAAQAVTAARAAGLGGERLTAAVEATCLDAAARAKADDIPVRPDGPVEMVHEGSDDLADEVRWLVQVARNRVRRRLPRRGTGSPASPAQRTEQAAGGHPPGETFRAGQAAPR
ncbi:MAB_1171c family putative transporter [Actinoplanes sp. NPDC049316]|uniref:MAB_1171c family putative transporter n=1 Tax=Actinoplanes sp. NPDC049316 TaxID=3154727 RepID=UPI003444753F